MSSLLSRTIFLEEAGDLDRFHVREGDAAGLHLTETAHPPGYRIPEHLHSTVSLYLVVAGALTEQVGRKKTALRAGDLVFTPANEQHSDVFEACGGRCFIIELPSFMVKRVLECAPLPTDVTSFQGPAAWLARKLYREFRFSGARWPLILEGLALEMMGEVCRRDSRKREANHSRLDRAEQLLESRFPEAVPLLELAQAADLHPIYFARLFRQRHNCSVGEYLRRRRIEAACARLVNSGQSLSEIALESGFCDQAHFSRVFHQLVGLTPSAYRSACRSYSVRSKTPPIQDRLQYLR